MKMVLAYGNGSVDGNGNWGESGKITWNGKWRQRR